MNITCTNVTVFFPHVLDCGQAMIDWLKARDLGFIRMQWITALPDMNGHFEIQAYRMSYEE